MKYPIVVHEQRIVPDSEGAGRYRGSPGARVEFGPIDGAPLDVVYLSDGTYEAARRARRPRGRLGTPAQALPRRDAVP